METKHFESLYPPESREKEIKQILTCIKSGNFNQTMSLPGGGRSQILRLLTYNRALRIKHLGEKEKLFHFVLCNFSEIRNKSLNDVLKFLFLSTVQSLRGIPPQARNDIFQTSSKEVETAEEELVIFNRLKSLIEHLTLEKNMTIVFLFDNFDEYLPMVTPDFFKDLRILRNLAIYKFSTVFALNRPLEEVADQQTIADIYQFIADHKVYLNLCDLPSLQFRISFIEKAFGKRIKKEIMHNLIALTGGHVNLIRLSVETILESRYPSISVGTTAQFLLDHKSIQGALLDIWNSLTPAEQNLLKGFSTSEAQKRTHLRGGRMDSSEMDDFAKRVRLGIMTDENYVYLENIGILKNGEITIKLLAEFINQKPLFQTEQNITFDAHTNEIKKGSLILSDKLTSFEFRLLKYLLQNTNRVVEREEIISVVWSNEKSTAGVTDEALDQLIFRLRHKIEPDPNNPTHLQTIKGRGFKFTL